MDDFIRRADAINAMANILVSQTTSDDKFNIGVRRCMSSVNDIPATDVEVRHGEWWLLETPDDERYEYGQCSLCCRYFYLSHREINSFKYCPNCGAMMDGETE